MDEATLLEIIREMHQKRDYSQIVEKVPYETRYSLFMNDVGRKYIDVVYYSMIDHLFTPEEAETLYNQIEDKSKKKDLFFLLEDKRKLELVDEVELDQWSSRKFVSSIKDDSTRLEMSIKFLNKGLINTFSISTFFEVLSAENKFTFLDKVLDYYLTTEDKLDEYHYESILKEFAEEKRFEVLKKLMEKSKSKKLSYFYLDRIIATFPDEQKREVLNHVIDTYIEEYKNGFYNIESLLNVFPEEQFLVVLKDLADKDLIDSFSVTNMLENYSLEKNIKVIDYLLEYCSHRPKSLVDDRTIARLLDRIPRDDGIKVYYKYAICTEGFGNLTIAKYCKNIEDTYFYLDYLIGVVGYNDFDRKFDILDIFLFELGNSASGVVEYPNVIDMYVKKHNVDRVHLVEFVKRFNYTALRFMNSKSIKTVINLPDEEFVKFMNIFNYGTMLDNNIINTICNSFLQREFRLVNKEDYSIFSQFEMLLAEKNDETSIKIAELLVKVSEVVNIDTYLNEKGVDFDQFVYDLTNDDTESLNLLHDMTQEYIMKKREEFVKGKLDNVFEEIGVDKKIERSFYKKKIFELCTEWDLKYICDGIPKEYITEEEQALLDNKELFNRLFYFKKSQTPLEDPSEKKYLKVLESLLNKSYEYKYSDSKFAKVEDIPYTYFAIAPSDEWLLGIIVECNVEQFVNKVMSDSKVYNELIAFIDKYKMLGWDKTFACFDKRADVVFNEGTLASIISNFYVISDIAKNKDANLTQYIDYANCYDSMSRTYSCVLGRDNYRAIAANEGKNKADMSKAERLSRVPKLIQEMYGRTEITTPPIDKDYDITNGKKLNVVLGNSTNMINLSYGERTNSCLRIGGAFNNLFEFCIHDKNGFHVRFTDPVTGEFVSRVSGLRNGNTIFFNELRDSENENYSNEDIIEVLKALSSELIEMTKDEECPIDNVVITYDYAMRDYENSAIPTELAQYPNVFYGNRFNIKLDGTFVLLKSTSSDDKLVPYEFGADLARTYDTQRDKIITYSDSGKIQDKMSQLRLIDSVLKGYDIEELTIDPIEDIKICIAGEDWYVAVDKDGNIHQFIVEMSKHKSRALAEMKVALEKIQQLQVEVTQEKATGGK